MPTGLMKNELKLVSKPQIEIILTLLTKGLHPLSFVERGSWLCSDNLSGIETPCSKLQRMFCLAAVLRSDCKEFYQFFDSLANPSASCGVSARCCSSDLHFHTTASDF